MKLEGHSNGVIVVEIIGVIIAFVLVDDLHGQVAEIFFVLQVFELDLRKSDGQILRQNANLERIECQVNGRILSFVLQRKEDDMIVKADCGVHVIIGGAIIAASKRK